jgi:hypothetical protein
MTGISGLQLGASSMVGVLRMAFTLAVMGWSVHRLLEKKSIAWTVSIIVIKYAVLLGSIYILTSKSWFIALGYGIGLTSFVLALLVFAVFEHWTEEVST